jgi:hypothetical protein
MTDICDQLTNNDYLHNLINIWKLGGVLNNETEVGYNCVTKSSTQIDPSLNLLDFLNTVVHIKKGNGNEKVGNWCNSCTTLTLTSTGYFTLSGALDIFPSNSQSKPLYYRTDDVKSNGNLYNYLNVSGDLPTWSTTTNPTVIVKTPADKIRQLDSDGTPLSSENRLNIKTVEIDKVESVSPNIKNSTSLNKYYYLFISVPDCKNIPLPVYQNAEDDDSQNKLTSSSWPLVGMNGNPYGGIGLQNCPDVDCNKWGWE